VTSRTGILSVARRSGICLACAAFFALCEVPAVRAGDYRAFSDSMAAVLANMRGAAFYLRKKNVMMGGFELDAVAPAWKTFVTNYADNPPEIYAADEKWRAALENVTANLGRARNATANGDVAAARRAVNVMRNELADLRRRNGVVVFEDCVAEMREAFGRLFVYRRKPPDFESPEQVKKVKAAAAVAEYVYRRCYESAPAVYRGDDMFERLFAQSFKDFKLLSPAIARGSTREFVDFLRQIYSYEDLIFVRFG
jgi:hypothetical protein